jgi:hypothetical protein
MNPHRRSPSRPFHETSTSARDSAAMDFTGNRHSAATRPITVMNCLHRGGSDDAQWAEQRGQTTGRASQIALTFDELLLRLCGREGMCPIQAFTAGHAPDALPANWQPVAEAWAWPFTVLLIAISFLAWLTYSTAARPFLSALFGRIRKITAFGVEFDLSAKAAIQTRTNVEAGFDELRSKVKRQFDMLIDSEGLNSKLLNLAENAVFKNLTSDEAKRSYRCTIHIQDTLFEDVLYQLLDYYPQGGGRGRTRSIRFGIIGRCARLNQPDVQADVTTNTEKLIESWSMTPGEAANVGRDRRSFAAIPLLDTDHALLGIFYVDARPRRQAK